MMLARFTQRLLRDGLVKTLVGVSRNAGHRLLEMRPSRRRSRAQFVERCRDFDRTHHVQTTGLLHLPQGSSDPLIYGPIDQDEFHAAFRRLPIDPDGYNFVDLGSGKGKAMFLAAALPFKRIIGVELSTELHVAALENIRTFRGGARHDLTALCTDATRYDLPPHPTVLFLFNPFGDAVMRLVVANVKAWCERYGQPLFVVYVRPHHAAVWREAGFNDVVYETSGCVIYRAGSAD